MSKFKVGDKVNYYAMCSSINGKLVPKKAVVDKIYRDDMIGITYYCAFDGNVSTSVHPNTCRLLLKKKRREFWLQKRFYHNQYVWVAHNEKPFSDGSEIGEVIHVKEIKEEK